MKSLTLCQPFRRTKAGEEFVIYCPNCLRPELRLITDMSGTPEEVFCTHCGWREKGKAWIEWRGLLFRHFKIQGPVIVVKQEAIVNGRYMRYLVVFTWFGTLVITVKRLPRFITAPRRSRSRAIKTWRNGSGLYVVLGWPEVLKARTPEELEASIIDVLCPVEAPQGTAYWVFKLLGIAPRCPVCRSFRVKPTKEKGTYQCECGAVFRWRPRT